MSINSILVEWIRDQLTDFYHKANKHKNINLNLNIDILEMPPKKAIENKPMVNQEQIGRPKKRLVELFKLLINKVVAEDEKTAPFKIKQYTETIAALDTYSYLEIQSVASVKHWLEVNGKKNPTKILEKVEEYLSTGTIAEAEKALENPIVKAVTNFTKIYGIGPVKAKELYNKYNITTIEELKQLLASQPPITAKTKPKDKIVNEKQQLGIDYYHQLEQRIPREEMDKYHALILEVATKVAPQSIISINGSYRRGHETSGDIDVLITAPNGQHSVCRDLIKKELVRLGIIVAVLADGDKKFMGITKLTPNSVARHMDLMDTSIETYPFAVLYFTGSGGFNVYCRHKALELGYSLNEYCISDKLTKKPIDSETIQAKIGKPAFQSEKDILDFIDVGWVDPKERNNVTMSKEL